MGGGENTTQEKGMLNYRGTVAHMLYSFQVRVHKELNAGRARVLSATIGPNPPVFHVSLKTAKLPGTPELFFST